MKEFPQDLNAERAIVACMVINSDTIGEICSRLNENDFYMGIHADIFNVCKKLWTNGQSVDLVTVNNELKSNKIYAEKGGPVWLTNLINNVQTTAGYRSYIDIVREKSILRATLKAAMQIANDVSEQTKTAKEILDNAQQELFAVASENVKDNSLTEIYKDIVSAVQNIEYLHSNRSAVPGLASGFVDLDKRIGGFQNGELIIIAGRPSMGKTAFALNIAENVATSGKAVAVFSLEMSRKLLIQRLLSSVSGMSASKLKYANIADNEWAELSNAAQSLGSMNILIDDSADSTAFDIRSKSRNCANKLKTKGKHLDLIVIDYLQLLRGDSSIKDKNNQIADISRQLKSLARDLDVPVIVLSQLSRAPEQRGVKNSIPVLSDLRDSGAIEQDADVVLFVWREGYYKPNDDTVQRNAKIRIGKNRNGACGDIDLIFEATQTKFFNKENEQYG
jgi:replicative DNA helicase